MTKKVFVDRGADNSSKMNSLGRVFVQIAGITLNVIGGVKNYDHDIA